MTAFLVNLLSGGIGRLLGGAVAGTAKMVALAPILLWLFEHKEQIAVSFSYGQLALLGGLCYVVIELVHRTPPS